MSTSESFSVVVQVLDMFGCGLPVCAVRYSCIGELVKDGINGLLFNSPQQLADQILSLLDGFPVSPSSQLSALTEEVGLSRGARWNEAWARTVQPVIERLLKSGL